MFYGSQTGTAEEYATRLAKEATRHGMPAMTFDPEECTDWVNTFSNFLYFSVKSVFLLVESSSFCILDVLIFVGVASYPFGVCVQEELSKLGSDIDGSLAIFCMATYGEGDPTDNAQELHDWLKSGEVDLSSLK